jgi:hypothetical protein
LVFILINFHVANRHIQEIDRFFLKRALPVLRYLLRIDTKNIIAYRSTILGTLEDLVFCDHYRKVLMRYKPRLYRGRLVLVVNEAYHRRNPTMGWKRVAAEGLEVHKVPGDHYSYLGENVRSTAEQLKACLAAAHMQTESKLIVKG